ncbi:sensor domain-containing diguanylate cyclase [Thalassotalea euphylliae]|uniref:EAL domain-containing protein n=1 Tax=Thalassotalea euphylliae TaxID=1655234 RepID=A0A3E0UJV3_9GAMM|nr:EAL domain-containing protein [Thalassotalea euphylliae]REL36834.1 EAL domain-containing protein [Thalassotalea euphylliae]
MNNSSDDKLSNTDESLQNDELELYKVAYQNLQQRHTALFKLNQLSQDCKELSTFYAQVHRVIKAIMTAENFYIVMYDQTLSTLEFVYHVDEEDEVPEDPVPYESFRGSLTSHVIESKEPLLATPNMIKQMANDGVLNHIGTAGMDWLGVPLLQDGYVIGVMAIQSYTENTRYTEEDKALLTYTAQHVVSALVRLQDHEQLQKAVSSRTRELMEQIREREKAELLQESLYRISELTNRVGLDINDFYGQVHNIIGQLINAENFFIAKYDRESDTIDFVYYLDQNSRNTASDFLPQKSADLYTALVIRRKQTCLLSYDEMYELYRQGETKKPQKETNSWLGVPLIADDDVIGVLVLQSYQKHITYNQQDAELLNFVSHHVSMAIKRRETLDYERRTHEMLEKQVKMRTEALEEEIRQRKQVEQMLKHNASHDDLTGLPNRVVFLDLLDHAINNMKRRPEMEFAVLFLDLDRFKMVNDSLGHHAGDLLLKVVAKELKSIIRANDTVARLGGDEFVVLIEDIDDKSEVYEIAQRITFTLAQPFNIDNQPVFIGTSIGILFSDDRYESAETMLRDADTAMYHAKDSGKGRFEEFDASMHQKIQEELSLEADIRQAIEQDEFTPYFQPIYQLDSAQVIGFEALARWQSSKRGMVMPNQFIPVAEETGLVVDIDLQIMRKACDQLKQWQAQGLCERQYVSCNLFGNHFYNPTLPDDITHILNSAGLEPAHLRIELTERVLLEENEVVLANMKALKQLGIKLLLDDFGTGYSSLSYVHRFPLDVVKIDRSFITDAHLKTSNRAIIKTIIDLAANLQLATISEGIECQEEADILTQMGCLYGQGYYFAKPMVGEQATALLTAGK